MKKISKFITLLSSSAIVVPTVTCFSTTSCGLAGTKSVDASDWEGVVSGVFYPDSYVVDNDEHTITYNSAVGMKFMDLVIPNYVNYNRARYKVLLGPSCFEKNKWLVGTIELNDFIDTIPNRCFWGCHNLQSVIFHKYPKKIGDLAFASTPVQQMYVKTANGLSNQWFLELGYIGVMGFYESWIAGDIVLGKDFYYLGKYAFGDCFQITSIDMRYAFDITSISEGAFEGCTALVMAYMPPLLESIDDAAFQMCTSLPEIQLSRDGMKLSLGNDAFYSCSGLRKFSRDVEITSIGDRCFWQATQLEIQPWLPQYGVGLIGTDAFASCSISSVSFDPNTIVDVKDTAFSYCPNLCCIDFSKYNVTIGAPKWTGRNIFSNISDTGTIYMSESALISDEWKTFFSNNGIVISQDKWKIIPV